MDATSDKIEQVNLRAMAIAQHLRCPKCRRATNGKEDFASLRDGCEDIRKTCRRCRIEIYACRKKSNPVKKHRPKYPEAYAQYLRCRGCNRHTSGPDEFKNIRSGKPTKTCSKCRANALAAWKKKPKPDPGSRPPKKKKLTFTQQTRAYKQMMQCLDSDTLDHIFADERMEQWINHKVDLISTPPPTGSREPKQIN